MTVGPGKYDDLATYVREQAEAEVVAVIVVGGNKGAGFSVQSTAPELMLVLPRLLRRLAEGIEAEDAAQ